MNFLVKIKSEELFLKELLEVLFIIFKPVFKLIFPFLFLF